MTKNSILKLLKTFAIFILTAFIIIGLFKLNKYLKDERLLFYKRGTDEKAILNATWRMSVKEVERSLNYKLTDGIFYGRIFTGEPFKNLKDINRVSNKDGKNIIIGGENYEVQYDFFDDQLFQITLLKEVLNKEKTDSIITTYLEPKYGRIIRDPQNKFSGTFKNKNVQIKYEQWEIKNHDKTEDRILIIIIYQPIVDEGYKIVTDEQKSIF